MMAIWIGLSGGVIGGFLANFRQLLALPIYAVVSLCVAISAWVTESSFREALFFGAAGIAICSAVLLLIGLLYFETASRFPHRRITRN